MKGLIKLAMYKDDKYGLISEFVNDNGNILFAYTKEFNNKFIYMLVSKEINDDLTKKYLSND